MRRVEGQSWSYRLSTGTEAGRLIRVGAPLLLFSSVLVFLPILGRHFLTTEEYATWALLMTVISGAALFDLGATAYVQTVGYGWALPRRLYWRAIGLSSAGAAAITALAWVIGWVWGAALSISTPPQEFGQLIVVCGLAAALRNAWTVSMARLQIAQRFGVRTSAAVAQSVLQVVLCWALLASGVGLWALPLSLLVSSALGLAFGQAALALRPLAGSATKSAVPLVAFASWRTLAAMVAVLSSQADRWVLAAFAPASFVADYDFAVRMASVPFGVVASVSGGLIAESAALMSTDVRRELISRMTRHFAAILPVLSVLDALVLLCLSWFGVVNLGIQVMGLFALALVWMGVNALTAPSTMSFVGAGKPQKELLYAVPATACSALGWAASAALDQPWLVPITTGLSLIGWSVWFIRYSLHHRIS